jgi:peptide subunit release factor 1 (eRF1)
LIVKADGIIRIKTDVGEFDVLFIQEGVEKNYMRLKCPFCGVFVRKPFLKRHFKNCHGISLKGVVEGGNV